jgi:hypothetical protein
MNFREGKQLGFQSRFMDAVFLVTIILKDGGATWGSLKAQRNKNFPTGN